MNFDEVDMSAFPAYHVPPFKIVYPHMPNPDEVAAVKDFDTVCRICAKVTFHVYQIFSDIGLEFELPDIIEKHLQIKVKPDDGLPGVVCVSCARALAGWEALRRAARLADAVLRRRLGLMRPPGPKPSATAGTTSEDGKWKSCSDSYESYQLTQNEINAVNVNNYKINDTDPYNYIINETDTQDRLSIEDGRTELEPKSHSDDDVPLSAIANTKKAALYNKFYDALVNFRNHFMNEHKSPEYNYPDFSDSNYSDEDTREDNKLDLNYYDDLTQCNMRKDRMDEETRLELNEVRTKLDGKVYFTCKACGKNLSSSHTYLFHKRIHTGERPCVCHICGKQFRAPSGLQRHLTETHERVRRYSCNMCPKNFVNLQNLKQHFRIHTGERPFECHQCGKRFTQSGTLHVHLKTHSEQFPHQCTECGAKFRLRSGLTRHRLKHTGERPHVCAHCGKGFRQRHELSGHALSHTDAKPHACGACGAAFRQRKALRHHAKRAHAAAEPHPRAYPHVQPY